MQIPRGLAPALLATSLVLTAATATAQDTFDPEERARALAGEVVVRVEPDPAGATGRIFALFDVNVPPASIWAVMLDCDRSVKYVKGLKACRVIERGPEGSWDIREHVISKLAILPTVRSVFRSDYDFPKSIRFERAGGDLKILEGSWRLTPFGNGQKTRLVYTARIGIDTIVPAAILRGAIESETRATLADLRQEALNAAKR